MILQSIDQNLDFQSLKSFKCNFDVGISSRIFCMHVKNLRFFRRDEFCKNLSVAHCILEVVMGFFFYNLSYNFYQFAGRFSSIFIFYVLFLILKMMFFLAITTIIIPMFNIATIY
eukprot:TRINITY_DN9743_c0_g2_i4.p4 TRINITY_DN9743_c0_g2~~TRINITY_DN9743_c0_g2_i4.p4  ORF type:complete len:115 (+),score=1.65 TRINITY_DN9743_c0_g2_i4:541-885(+)